MRYEVDSLGHYRSPTGELFGGRYVPEVLMPALEELEEAFERAKVDPSFQEKLAEMREAFIGRPTPFYFARNLSEHLGGAQIFIKNEGAALTGAHKINHCVGQSLLALGMGKKRIVAETGAGQHGLATATVCANLGLECIVYMGEEDYARQRPNVFWMQRLGAKVIPVTSGTKRLKDAVNEAIKDWITNVQSTHYLLGSALGPHPFPEINRYFQRVVGEEIKAQSLARCGRLPDYVLACVGGGSNSIGAFDPFLSEPSVKLIGVEAGGKGLASGEHASRFEGGRLGVVEGYKSYWLLDRDGQTSPTHSISAGLDYPGVGPLHGVLRDSGRVRYVSATDEEVLKAFSLLAAKEGLLSALESAHALVEAIKLAPTLNKDHIIVVNLSGRAEKDMFILARALEDRGFLEFTRDYAKQYAPSETE